LIGKKGKGLEQEKFNLEDWKSLRSFYDRVDGEVRCAGIPKTFKSLTEKSIQGKF